MVLARVVREAARRFGGAAALVAPDGSSLRYADLDRRSDAVAAGLRRAGVGEGDVVALRLPSRERYVLAYIAAAKVGAITAGVNPRLAPPEQAALVDLAGPRLVIDDESAVDDLERAGRDHQAPAPLPPHAERVVALVFTSGTTGTPKGAVFCERQLEAIWQVDAGGAWAPDGARGAPMLASTQMAHVGFMTKLPWYLATASRIHLLDRWRAADALRVIAEQRMTTIGGVAPQLALMLRAPDFESYDLSAVQAIVMGGAASPPALVEEARRRIGAAYSIRYSSTESGGCGTGTAFDADDDEARFTVGRPRPGIEVRIDAVGSDVGEVLLRSPTTMSAYWYDAGATSAVLDDGWLRTGDLGVLDDRGLLRLVGRASEMYIRGGYNVFPQEVEAHLASHPAVAECAVVPRPDAVMGEIGVAVVVARNPASPPSLADLRAHAARGLAPYKLPEDLRIVTALPQTAMQKLDRRSLAAHEATSTSR